MANGNDEKFEGEWLTDSKTGCRIWLYHAGRNKRVRWTGACVNDMADGVGTMTLRFELEDGQRTERYEGTFKRGKMHGRGAYSYHTGDRYEGEFKDGRMAGRGVYTWTDGKRFEGEWKNDAPHGRGVMIEATGDRREGEWIEGRGARSTPLHPQPAWDLARAGRVVAGGLMAVFEEEGGRLSPELMHRLHHRLLHLSVTLGREAHQGAKLDTGIYDGTKIDHAKVQATWILSGFMEEIENRRLPPRKDEDVAS